MSTCTCSWNLFSFKLIFLEEVFKVHVILNCKMYSHSRGVAVDLEKLFQSGSENSQIETVKLVEDISNQNTTLDLKR